MNGQYSGLKYRKYVYVLELIISHYREYREIKISYAVKQLHVIEYLFTGRGRWKLGCRYRNIPLSGFQLQPIAPGYHNRVLMRMNDQANVSRRAVIEIVSRHRAFLWSPSDREISVIRIELCYHIIFCRIIHYHSMLSHKLPHNMLYLIMLSNI